jgi:hypothetical protein
MDYRPVEVKHIGSAIQYTRPVGHLFNLDGDLAGHGASDRCRHTSQEAVLIVSYLWIVWLLEGALLGNLVRIQ